jgi:hypothetical protein
MSLKIFSIGVLFLCQFPPARAQDAQQPQPSAPQSVPAKPAAAQSNDEVNTGGGFSIEPYYWLTSGRPALHSGSTFTGPASGNFGYPGKTKRTPGAILSFPAGKGSTLRISAFRVQGSGSTAAAQDLNLFTTGISKGDLLSAAYTIQNVKVSWDYLTYPIRPGFRLKTLWEVQYTNTKSKIDALLDPNAAAGSAITAKGSRQVVLPTFGLGLENTVSRHFRWEVKGSGFALPHRSVIWDAEATLAFRVGQFEILGGEKAYHFKSAPKKEQYLATTLKGAYVGVRWYLK